MDAKYLQNIVFRIERVVRPIEGEDDGRQFCNPAAATCHVVQPSLCPELHTANCLQHVREGPLDCGCRIVQLASRATKPQCQELSFRKLALSLTSMLFSSVLCYVMLKQ